MTRAFGFETPIGAEAHIPNGIKAVLENLQVAVARTYEKGWQAYGLGFIVVGHNSTRAFSVYQGYRGINSGSNVEALIPPELHLALANKPRALFAVLQNGPDEGEEAFNLEDRGRTFPLESDNWMVITMGSWWNGGFSDETLPWYNSGRPSLSVIQYLETAPEPVTFDWIDARRTPYIIAVKKDGTEIHVVDKYTGHNDEGLSYVTDQTTDITHYKGVRNQDGSQD